MNWLDIAGTIIGLVYIYQEYKASIWLWVTGLIMPMVYMFVYYEAGLYADFGMQVYYVLAAIYGLLVWKYGKKRNQKTEELPITKVKRSLLLPSLLFFLAAWGALYLILIRFTNSTVPILDSFGNSLSFVGLWWLSRNTSSNGGSGSSSISNCLPSTPTRRSISPRVSTPSTL